MLFIVLFKNAGVTWMKNSLASYKLKNLSLKASFALILLEASTWRHLDINSLISFEDFSKNPSGK